MASNRGFSLLELLVASAMFLLIGGAAFALFQKQQTASRVVQGEVGLNLGLRNAATQLQIIVGCVDDSIRVHLREVSLNEFNCFRFFHPRLDSRMN